MESLRLDDPRRLGPYRVVGRFERSMGRLPSAQQRYIGRTADGDETVVVTVPRNEFTNDGAYEARFRAEAEQVRRLASSHHTWLTQVVDIAEKADRPAWYVTRYSPALPLTEALTANRGPLPERTVRALGAVAAEALASLHSTGFSHAGITPTSFLIAADGPRLEGFGAVRCAVPDGQDRSGAPGLVAECMAPEQLVGGRPRPLGDVYALGAVLSYAATGHMTAERSELPDELQDIILACMRRDPAARPTSAQLLEGLTPRPGTENRAPAGAPPTELDGLGPSATTGGPSRPVTMLDGGTSGSARLLEPGWLPGRVIAAIAEQTALTLAAENDEIPGQAAQKAGPVVEPGHAVAVPTGADSPGVRGSSSSAATTAIRLPGVRLPSRRSLLTGTAGGAAGIALGASGFTAASALGIVGGTGPSHREVSGVPPTPLWAYRIAGDAPNNAPYVWRDKILVVTGAGECVGLSARTGKKLWNTDGMSPLGPPVGAGANLIMLADTGPPNFLSPKSGKVRWRAQEYDNTEAKGDLQNVIGSWDGVIWFTVEAQDGSTALVAFDPGERREKWRSDLPDGFSLQPLEPRHRQGRKVVPDGDSFVLPEVYGNDSLASPQEKKRFIKVARKDGRTGRVKTYDGVTLETHVVPLAGGAFVMPTPENLRAVNLTDGKTLWILKTRSQATKFGEPAVHDGRVYAVDSLANLYAVEENTGDLVWHRDHGLLAAEDLGDPASVRVSQSGKTVLIVNKDEIVAVEAGNGDLLWRFSDVSGTFGGFAVDPGRLITFADRTMFVLHNKSVYALPVE